MNWRMRAARAAPCEVRFLQERNHGWGNGLTTVTDDLIFRRQNFHRRVVTGNAADGSATQRTGTAKENIFPFRLHAPGPGILFFLGERKARRVLKDVAVVHA